MGNLLAVLTIVASVFAAALSDQLADEFRAWTPWLTQWLIDRAASKLPEPLRDRYKEEWASHVADIPGQVGKLLVAASFLRAASAIRADFNEIVTADPAKLPLENRFGLLPEPEDRWGTFGISLLTNVLIFVLLISLTRAVKVPRAEKSTGICGSRLATSSQSCASALIKRR
jgi:hypothetical protein